MLYFLKKLSIGTQLLLLAISTGIIMLIIILSIYFDVSKVVAKYNNEYTDNIMFQVKKNIVGNCDFMDRLLTSIAYNRVVQNYTIEKDDEERFSMYDDINNFFITLSEMNEGIIDFVLLDENGEKVYFLKGENDEVKETIRNLPIKNDHYYTGVKRFYIKDEFRDCFIIASNMYSILSGNITGSRIGTAAIVFDAKALSLDFDKSLHESATSFYLLDRNNKIYSTSQLSSLDKNTEQIAGYAGYKSGRYVTKADGKRYVINKEDLREMHGKIISVVPEEKLFYDLEWARTLTIAFFVIALFLLSIPFAVIINNIVSPLKKFMKFITSLKSGNLKGLKQRINLEGYEEIVIMAGEFNGLLDEIDDLTHRLVTTTTRLYETELEKKKSELEYLKSQINPHFLYNTLEVMRSSATDEGAYTTAAMVKALGKIFRYSVKGEYIVRLYEEIEITKYYLQIQQARFDGRFKFIYQMTDESLNCSIPKMILQPIVENAIFHGLETKLGEGHLWIESKIDEYQNLYISIKDDGTGMDREKLNYFQKILNEGQSKIVSSEGSGMGIGIINVNNRIKLIYGSNYGINIESILGHGTEVIIKIPTRRGNDV